MLEASDEENGPVVLTLLIRKLLELLRVFIRLRLPALLQPPTWDVGNSKSIQVSCIQVISSFSRWCVMQTLLAEAQSALCEPGGVGGPAQSPNKTFA